MDIGTLIIVAIILFNIIRSFSKAAKKNAKKSGPNQPVPQQTPKKSKGKLEDWLGDYLKQIEEAANDQKEKTEQLEELEEQQHSVFEKDAEEAAHYEKEKHKYYKLRDEKEKHKHSDLYKGKVNKDFFEERQRIAKSRKRIIATTDNAAFDLTKRKKKRGDYKFVARDAVIGSIILNRYTDPLLRLDKF